MYKNKNLLNCSLLLHLTVQIKEKLLFQWHGIQVRFPSYRTLDLPSAAVELAATKNFELAGYSLKELAHAEETRAARVVRVGAIQNQIVLPTQAYYRSGNLLCRTFSYLLS